MEGLQERTLTAADIARPAVPRTLNLILAGVGGQGLIHLSKEAVRGLEARLGKVISSQQRGLAKTRGSVAVHVRAGLGLRTAEIFLQRADVLVATEVNEAGRYAGYLGSGSVCLYADIWIGNSLRGTGSRRDALERFRDCLEERGARGHLLPVQEELMERRGLGERQATLAMLGAMQRLLDLPGVRGQEARGAFDPQAWGYHYFPTPTPAPRGKAEP